MFLDTNVLVRARFEAAPERTLARRRLRQAGMSGEALRISRQVLREYLATVTRRHRLPWKRPAALTAAFEILEDGPRVTRVLMKLCGGVPVTGRQIHDAHIAATMLAHGERRLLTFNPGNVRRYGERIELIDMETSP